MGMALPGSPPCPKFLGGWGLHFGTTGFGVQEWGLSSFHRLCSLGTPRHKRGVISQRHFHLENRLPAPSLAPKPGWGGGGAARGTGGNDVPWKTQAGGGRMPARSLPALCTGYRDGRKICNFPGNFLQSGSKMPGSDCKTAAADDPHSPRPRIPGRAPPTHPRVPVGSLAEPGPVLAAAGTAVAEPG